MDSCLSAQSTARLHIAIRGVVLGVGFRPAMYRLATGLGLSGWVQSDADGGQIELEGPCGELGQFLLRLEQATPPRASLQSIEPIYLDPVGYSCFTVRQSNPAGPIGVAVLPDISTCRSCRRELADQRNRRFRYPFISCTRCGPRFSIVESLPYQRDTTTMRHFGMCPECQAEYTNPLDRRFRAEPIACPRCGPQLELWDPAGATLASGAQALLGAAQALRDGQVVAVKGVGGFHLMVDARSERAVAILRQRKAREEQPFALLYPGLARLQRDCEVTPLERRLLSSPEAPIVLLRQQYRGHGEAGIATNVAPDSVYLGAMLPSNPLHILLMGELSFPLVATSGNTAEEPICCDERVALEQLGGIADLFLVHNRTIARHSDDSIVQVVLGRERLLRRARGYAPLPLTLAPGAGKASILAVGAELKHTVALALGNQVLLSQDLGDLAGSQSFQSFQQVIGSLAQLYQAQPDVVVCDQHPDYRSTRFARAYAQERSLPLLQTQHHVAHVLSCMAEHQISGPALGVAWDGGGYGDDGNCWGGEFFLITDSACERIASLRDFPLVGGEQAASEPRHSAFGALYEMIGEPVCERDELAPLRACSTSERAHFLKLIQQHKTPRTSSAGHLVDAVAALLDLRQTCQYEGQAAALLERAALEANTERSYSFDLLSSNGLLIVDWEPMLHGVLDDLRGGVEPGVIAASFYNALAVAILAVALQLGEPRVLLSGGCFANSYLLERTAGQLHKLGLIPYWHQRVPCNDGGIALGQTLAARRQARAERRQQPA